MDAFFVNSEAACGRTASSNRFFAARLFAV
jgi:hypothetical protein